MANNYQRRDQGDRAHLPRAGHSLSHAYAFTAAAGQLLPTFWDYAFPGDKYSLKTDFDLSRALPLLQPASLDIEVVTDYFFVPMELMRLDFGEVYYGTNNVFSTGVKNTFRNALPKMRLTTAGFLQNRFKRGTALFEGFGKSVFRLLDMFGYNPLIVSPRSQLTIDVASNRYQTIFGSQRPVEEDSLFFNLLAYQCIYQYYYRDEEHEVFDPSAFNIDDLNGGTVRGSLTANSADQALEGNLVMAKYLQLRYVNRRSDYFTDVFRSALLTTTNVARSASTLGADQFGLHNWLSDNRFSPLSVDRFGLYDPRNSATSVGSDLNSFEPYVNDTDPSQNSVLSGVLNTAALRAMFAQEKLLRLTAAAKKNYDDQTLAHFGVEVPHDVKHQITHFGRNVMKYQVSEVVSTAQTDQAPLGEQAGRLYGANKNKDFAEFRVPVHGIVMAITFVRPDFHYIVPKMRLNMYTSIGDFWKPEYDHIGPQPVFRPEVMFNYADSQGQGANPVVGWQYRYTENKRRFNRASYAFAGGTYNAYLLTTAPWQHTVMGQAYNGYVGNWSWIDNNNPAAFKVSPNDTDGIFGSSYVSTWEADEVEMPDLFSDYSDDDIISVIGQRYFDDSALSPLTPQAREAYIKEIFFSKGDFDNYGYQVYQTDPFVLNARIKCNKVSFMSKNSLAKLDM